MDVLDWLHARGCPFDHTALLAAAAKGHMAALEWLRARGCPWEDEERSRMCWSPWYDDSVSLVAVRNGHLDVLVWARSEGCPPWDSGRKYPRRLDVTLLNWAVLLELKWNARAYETAVSCSCARVVRWAKENADLVDDSVTA